MAFQEVGGIKKFKQYKDMEVGEVAAEGWYIGESKSNYINPNYDIKDKDTGEIVVANGCGTLRIRMEEKNSRIIPGDYIRIEYHGTDIMRKGLYKGKESHNVKLFVDKTLFDPTMGQNVSAPVSEVVKPKPTAKPVFKEVEEEVEKPSRKSFAESLEEEDDEDLVF